MERQKYRGHPPAAAGPFYQLTRRSGLLGFAPLYPIVTIQRRSVPCILVVK